MTRDVQSVLLILVGGALMRISVDDTYLRYVKESMRPWLVASAVVLLALAAANFVSWVREAPSGETAHDRRPHGDLHDDAGSSAEVRDDGHGHGRLRAAWLLVLPVLALYFVAPPALGSYTAGREQATVVQPDGPTVPGLPPGDPVDVALSDFAMRAVWDGGNTLKGRTVRMTGFVTRTSDDGWDLTRLSLTCCAADALATKVKMIHPPVSPKADTWVTVTGQWVPGGRTNDQEAVPWLQVADVVEVAAPTDPYE